MAKKEQSANWFTKISKRGLLNGLHTAISRQYRVYQRAAGIYFSATTLLGSVTELGRLRERLEEHLLLFTLQITLISLRAVLRSEAASWLPMERYRELAEAEKLLKSFIGSQKTLSKSD